MNLIGEAEAQPTTTATELPWEPKDPQPDKDRLEVIADDVLKRCRGEGPANCVLRCPLHVDARGYVQLTHEGRYQDALQRVREQLPFPGILGYICAHPCELHCKKVDEDSPIRIRDIKRFLADREDGAPRHILDSDPPREQSVAVVGAGPAGLIAAHDLKRKGYLVTIYEREEQIGGCLRYKIPDYRLPRRVLERDLSIIDALKIEVRTRVDVGEDLTLDQLRSEHDAVLVLVGYKGGLDLLERGTDGVSTTVRDTVFADPLTCETGIDGVFAGGDAVSGPSTVIQSLALGRRAAASADLFLRGEDLRADREPPLPQPLLWALDIDEAERQSRVRTPVMLKPYNEALDEKQAREEAERCLDCECGLCVKDCEFLTKYCNSPKELARQIKAGLLDEETVKMVFSCNICSLCAAVCPVDLDTGEMLLEGRRKYIQLKGEPLKVHGGIVGYWKVGVNKLFTFTMPAPGRQRAKSLFFTGCALPRVAPKLTVQIYDELRRHYPDTGVMQLCCGAPVELIGMEEQNAYNKRLILEHMERLGAEELWVACPDCRHDLTTGLPGVKISTIWEKLAPVWEPPRKREGETIAIHDSCKARHAPGVHSAVRKLLRGGGAEIEDIEYKEGLARCCGFGGMIFPVDAELSQRVTNRRADESELPMITYCGGCRMALHGCGKEAIHILDFLFDDDIKAKLKAPPPNTILQYLNRLKTKWRFRRLRPLGAE